MRNNLIVKLSIMILSIQILGIAACGPSWQKTKRHPNGIYEDMRPGHEGECWNNDNERVDCPK